MGIQKIATEHFRWGLKWERIAPNNGMLFPTTNDVLWQNGMIFLTFKSSKMLSFDSVARGHRLIDSRPSDKNSSFVQTFDRSDSDADSEPSTDADLSAKQE